MPKFENSQYAKLWSAEGRQVMSEILSTPDMVKLRNTFYQTRFKPDTMPTVRQSDGSIVFEAKMREIKSGSLMDLRAPLAESIQGEAGDVAVYRGSIPDLSAKSTTETAHERMYKQDLFEQFGDAQLLANFAQEVLQAKLDSATQTLSNMAAQLMSKGEIEYTGGSGLKMKVIKAEIPTWNFQKAGVKIWSDPTAPLIDILVKKVEEAKMQFGIDVPFVLDVTKAQFDKYFLTNNQVKDRIKFVYSSNGNNLPDTFTPTQEMALTTLALQTGMPKILIVEEAQRDGDTIVHGWKADNVVLRPEGWAGKIMYADPLEIKAYSPNFTPDTIVRNFTKVMGGLATFMNTTKANGNFKEWHTDLLMAAVPTLDEFLYHIIIDTTTADA